MADQGISVRVTRLAAKKRAAEESSASGAIKKKRVVLGEIQNVLPCDDAGLRKNQKIGVENEKKSKSKRDVKRGKGGKVEEKETDPAIDLDGQAGDPQMCEAYASDIYEYLHRSEVSFNWICWQISGISVYSKLLFDS